MKTSLIAAAATLAILSVPTVVSAQPTATVQTEDLDLAKPADQKKLEERMDNAVRRMCRADGFDAQVRRLERECRLAATQDAAPKIEFAIAEAREGHFAAIDLGNQG